MKLIKIKPKIDSNIKLDTNSDDDDDDDDDGYNACMQGTADWEMVQDSWLCRSEWLLRGVQIQST